MPERESVNGLPRSGKAGSDWKSRWFPGWIVIFAPVVAFYGLLYLQSTDIPYWDDYDAVLGVMEHLSALPTTFGRVRYLAASQHNEYRLVFENLVLFVQTRIYPRLDFATLSGLGDAFVLPILYLLWRNFLPAERDHRSRRLLFIPVPFLLFQLNYAETLNWTVASLQNLPVIAFSLACISCLCRPTKVSFTLACGCLALAIAASGNGFLLCPIGLLILVGMRRRAEAGIWFVLGSIIVAVYFYHYQFASSKLVSDSSALHLHPYLKPLFAVSFIGSAVGFDSPIIRYVSLLLGVALCVAVALMARERYWKTNPTLSYFVLFIVLTAIAVTATRSSLGFGASLASRYRIYSDLLLICVYEFACQSIAGARIRDRALMFRITLMACVLFCVGCDIYGYKFLAERNSLLIRGVQVYEKSGETLGPAIPASNEEKGIAQHNNIRFRMLMHEAEKDDLYRFPKI